MLEDVTFARRAFVRAAVLPAHTMIAAPGDDALAIATACANRVVFERAFPTWSVRIEAGAVLVRDGAARRIGWTTARSRVAREVDRQLDARMWQLRVGRDGGEQRARDLLDAQFAQVACVRQTQPRRHRSAIEPVCDERELLSARTQSLNERLCLLIRRRRVTAK